MSTPTQTHTTIPTAELKNRVSALMGQAHEDLAALVSCQSVADPRQFPASECAKAAQLVIEKFTKAGLQEVRLEETPDGHPSVYGHIPAPDGAPTVLLYCHYDVQPPLDPSGTAWKSPVFELTERDGRWYGRGAADCKGNIVVHLTALRALAGDLPVGVKLIAEGSEEQGTGGLERFVPGHAELLSADAILVADTGNFAVGVPTLTTSLRGLTNVVVSVSTLENAMHSGMFGGPAPDALLALIGMLSTLRDARGNTTIKGLASDASMAGRRLSGRSVPLRRARARRRRSARRRRRAGHAVVAPGGHRARDRLPAGRRIGRRDPPAGTGPRQPTGTPRHRRSRRLRRPSSPTCTPSRPGTPRCRSSPRHKGSRSPRERTAPPTPP